MTIFFMDPSKKGLSSVFLESNCRISNRPFHPTFTPPPTHVSLEALKELQIPQILEEVGFNTRQQAEALANIIGRMCAPRSERATAKWLKEKSALGELLKHDFTPMPLIQLYRASD
ncbi:MAG: hypothetical protein RLZZ282_535, partial [Verrucomicrobiota bacterium]